MNLTWSDDGFEEFDDEANNTNNQITFNLISSKQKGVVSQVATLDEDNSDVKEKLYSTYQLTYKKQIALQTKNHALKKEVKSLK